jgi:hypothetical protein
MFTYPVAQFFWSFVSEALGTTLDVSEFLTTRENQSGKKRCLFWLVLAAVS